MVPDINLQLGVAIKALRDVIIPAIDPANGVAIEQAQLTLATLAMAREHLPFQERLVRTELANAIAIGEAVADAQGNEGDLAEPLAIARGFLESPQCDVGGCDAARLDLLAAVERTVSEASHERFASVSRAYLRAASAQFALQRKWCAGAGFDPGAKDLPALDDMLR